MFDKLKFWEKKPEFDFDKDLGLDLGPMPDQNPQADIQNPRSDLGPNQLGPPKPEEFAPNQPMFDPMQPPQSAVTEKPMPTFEPAQDTQNTIDSKNLEVISYKLDAIQAILNSINQRLTNLEMKEKDRYKF